MTLFISGCVIPISPNHKMITYERMLFWSIWFILHWLNGILFLQIFLYSPWVNCSSFSLSVASSSWDSLCCCSSIVLLSSYSASCFASNLYWFLFSSSSSASILPCYAWITPMFKGSTFHFLLLSPVESYMILFLGATFLAWGVICSSSCTCKS